MTVLRYTAFTTDPAGGNPAGVVLDAGGLTDAAMQEIAAEVGHSESAFLTSGVQGADGLRATLTSVEPYVEAVGEVAEVLEILGWQAEELDPELPPYVAYAGARHLVLAAATRQRLADLDYDFDRLLAYMLERDLTTLQLVWRESPSVFHVRVSGNAVVMEPA
jgi:predicted PhzF superfamily epimerase YddE/YHI9